jgi:hypothetical protein
MLKFSVCFLAQFYIDMNLRNDFRLKKGLMLPGMRTAVYVFLPSILVNPVPLVTLLTCFLGYSEGR